MANTTATVYIKYPKNVGIVRAGMPVDANGYIVNDATAYGIVAADTLFPATTATVITAGEWNEEISAANGVPLSDECKIALSAIKFTDQDGIAQPVNGLPKPEAGKIVVPGPNAYKLASVAEAVADATEDTVVDTVNAIIASLVEAGLMAEYVEPEEE